MLTMDENMYLAQAEPLFMIVQFPGDFAIIGIVSPKHSDIPAREK